MAEAERQLARALDALVTREFPQSRGREARLDAYLALDELLRLEDSEASVRHLRGLVPALLTELRHDLQRATASDVLHAALRALSYLLFHRSLATAFSAEQISACLGELVRLLCSTQDQATYKLCLWCLTMQNFAAERHQFLSRTVEALVQAVVNPFKSRAIEVQALKGLHLLLIKYPQQLACNAAVLGIWLRPIASRLGSSEASTRTHARLVIQEMSCHLAEWSDEGLTMVQDCIVDYVLPVMKTHMDKERPRDALHLWQLTLVLLKMRLSADLGLLNQLLYVPETCMRHEDAAVRLMSMQAWAGLVDVFHESKEWLFKKPVVHLLMWPISVCLEEELLLNIVEAAFVSWRKIVSVAVRDFNTFCQLQDDSAEIAQQNKQKWKRWFHEMIESPILTLVKVRLVKARSGTSDEATVFEVNQFIDFTKQIWETGMGDVGDSKSAVSGRSDSSSVTTVGGSSVDGSGAGGPPAYTQSPTQTTTETQCKNVGELDPLDEADDENYACVRINSNLIGVAFLLPDIFAAVESLINVANEVSRDRSKQHTRELAMVIWKGLCERIHYSVKSSRTQAMPKLGLRLLRMSIDFSFGISTAPTATTDVPATDAESKQAEQFNNQKHRFGFQSQLELLAPLMFGIASPGDLQLVLQHSKSKLFNHIFRRMNHLTKTYDQCEKVLRKWYGADAGEFRIDFSVKQNVLPYAAIYLLCEYAVYGDGMNDDNTENKQSKLGSLEITLVTLVASMKAGTQQLSQGLESVIQLSGEAIRVMHEHVENVVDKAGKGSMLDMLLELSDKSSVRSFENQQNDSLLLDLHQSRSSYEAIIPSASTVSSSSLSDTLEIGGKISGGIVGESILQAPSTCTSSPCLLSGEVAAEKSAPIYVNPSPASSMNEHSQPEETKEQNAELGIIASAAKHSTEDVPVTPRPVQSTDEANSPESRSVKSRALPVGSMSAPPKLADTQNHSSSARKQRTNAGMIQCIYPDLVGCSEGIASLYRHFPMGFRPFFSFYKVKTIGDLSALPVERVRTFGLKDPVVTVRRALEEFNGRKDRMKTLVSSPFRKRNPKSPGSATTSPSIGLPSPHKPSKRPFHLETDGIEKRNCKRARRSLALDEAEENHEENNEESEGTRRQPKLADRVTFCLPVSGETGETRITRPGEDSQEQLRVVAAQDEEKETVQEKMDTYTIKLLQHLRRSAHYMDKLVTKEESLSEEASLQTAVAAVSGVITNYQEAHELVAKLAAQLQVAAEASSTRCRNLLEKREGSLPSRRP